MTRSAGGGAAEPRQALLDLLPPLLADFLATDVREDVLRCDELLAGIAAATSEQPFEAVGNVYEMIAEPGVVIIRNGYDERADQLHLSASAVVNVLTAWRGAISQRDGLSET